MSFGCAPSATNDINTRSLAQAYFDHYNERNDWDGFLERFHRELAFEDPVAGVNFTSRAQFKDFYNWPDSAFQKHPDYPETMVLRELVVDGRLAIGKGYFTPFLYHNTVYGDQEEMSFTIWLYFDEDGLVTRQIDWIDYPQEIMELIVCNP